MARNLFEEHSRAILASLVEGVSVADAARDHGVGERTIERWIASGRRDPEGTYGSFAAQVDAAREQRKMPSHEELEELTEGEIRGLLTRLARKGSIPAIKLYCDRFLVQSEPLQAQRATEAAAILAGIDELAAKRATRAV